MMKPPTKLMTVMSIPALTLPGDEFRGAVHLAVEVDLALDLALAADRLLLGDRAGVVLRVDGHLLAGQAVQGEAGGDLGDARRALRDDHHLHGDDDDEDDEADHEAVGPARADDEGGEGPDHLDVEVGALGEDEPHRRDVEGEAEDRRDEEHGREDRELRRLPVKRTMRRMRMATVRLKARRASRRTEGIGMMIMRTTATALTATARSEGLPMRFCAHEALGVSHCFHLLRCLHTAALRDRGGCAASATRPRSPYTWARTAAMAW